MGLYSASDVKSSIAAKTLVPSFQRIVSISNSRIVGFEVLTRCLHPKLGATLPDNFITIAEKLGLMREITSQVAVKAIAAAATLPNLGAIAINLTSSQFGSKGDLAQISFAAQQFSLPADRIVLEISEDTIFRNTSNAQRIIRQFKDLGYKIALDNCGARCAAFSLLPQMGFDVLKIDRRLTHEAFVHMEARKTVMEIVAVARKVGSSVVAMGIETRAQLATLESLGCGFAEGYLFGPSVLDSELHALIAGRKSSVHERPEDAFAAGHPAQGSFEAPGASAAELPAPASSIDHTAMPAGPVN